MIRTIIIDDDKLAVVALETILSVQPNIELVAMGHSGQEAIDLVHQHQPDLVLMDIRMEPMNGLEAATHILQHNPRTIILFLTTFQDDTYIHKAMSLGCKGYLLKQNVKGLLPAIEAAYNGHLVYDSQIIRTLTPQPESPTIADLSERENTLLSLVAEGLNNREIAQRLYLSEGTIRNYISLLMEKVCVRDRTQLAIFYYKNVHSNGGTLHD